MRHLAARDFAFTQAVLETGWFAFPGSPAQNLVPPPAPGDTTWPGFVLPRDHNYAGLGAFPGSTVFMRMPTPTDGVRAQLQHLRNYADAGSRSNNLGAPFEARPGYDAYAFATSSTRAKPPVGSTSTAAGPSPAPPTGRPS